MAKFKVGDRVRLVNDGGGYPVCAGAVGVVSRVYGEDDDVPDVAWGPDGITHHAKESRLVHEPRPSAESVRRNTSISVNEGVIRVWDRGGKQVVRCPVALWPTVREAVRNAAAELDAATKE